ncbi:MAG: Type II secretion system protein F [Lentisphaerae bacterium ADurb.Bin242]|nr:MAG: Type II secretion system protein F [Lentisphaerae bacterium ADurb.Bin242]
MPNFIYTAMDANGKEQRGKKEAANEEEVSIFLKNQGLFPTSIKSADKAAQKMAATAQKDKKGAKDKKKSGFNMNINLGPVMIKSKDLTILTRQMAILLDAGLPLIRSLKTLSRQAKNPVVKSTLEETATSVEAGSTFSEALAQHPKSFDKLYLNMIRAGEAAGKLELILDRLAVFREKAAKIQGKVKSAMVYPCIVLSIAIIITSGLMIFIVPKFEKTFTELLEGAPLPALTQFVMGISKFMIGNVAYLVPGIIGGAIAFRLTLKVPFLRYYIDWVKYNMPLFGPIVSRSAISKFARTLGTLMGSGVPILNALNIVKETAGNEVVSQAVQKVYDAVKEGEGMAGPLQLTKIFPEMVISMIEVGEETGKLPEMLDKIADTYDEEVDNAVAALTSMIEPVMMVGLAVVVGGIVIALFMPMISIIERLGGG